MEDNEFSVKEFEVLGSTQDFAKNLREANPWTVILAKEQTQGRGRKGNEWYSPKGGLYFSVILPKTKIENLEILTYLSAFCVAKVIFEKLGLKVFIKFPNDIYFQGKKMGGILVENQISSSGKVLRTILGIGLSTNIQVFPQSLQKKVTSLFLELKKPVNNEELFWGILKELKNLFSALV